MLHIEEVREADRKKSKPEEDGGDADSSVAGDVAEERCVLETGESGEQHPSAG